MAFMEKNDNSIYSVKKDFINTFLYMRRKQFLLEFAKILDLPKFSEFFLHRNRIYLISIV